MMDVAVELASFPGDVCAPALQAECNAAELPEVLAATVCAGMPSEPDCVVLMMDVEDPGSFGGLKLAPLTAEQAAILAGVVAGHDPVAGALKLAKTVLVELLAEEWGSPVIPQDTLDAIDSAGTFADAQTAAELFLGRSLD